jgi:hypothetical protein
MTDKQLEGIIEKVAPDHERVVGMYSASTIKAAIEADRAGRSLPVLVSAVVERVLPSVGIETEREKQRIDLHGKIISILPAPPEESDCLSCGRKWNTSIHNACQCGATIKKH